MSGPVCDGGREGVEPDIGLLFFGAVALKAMICDLRIELCGVIWHVIRRVNDDCRDQAVHSTWHGMRGVGGRSCSLYDHESVVACSTYRAFGWCVACHDTQDGTECHDW